MCVCVCVSDSFQRDVWHASFFLRRNLRHPLPVPPNLPPTLALGREAEIFAVADDGTPKPQCVCGTGHPLCKHRQAAKSP